MNVDAVSKLPRTEYTIFRDIYLHSNFRGISFFLSHLRQLAASNSIESFRRRNRASEGVLPTTK